MSLYSTVALIVATVVATVYVALRVYLRVTQHLREPPLIEFAIPFITPLLGFMNNRYFLKLR
jgi:hypothetical protein